MKARALKVAIGMMLVLCGCKKRPSEDGEPEQAIEQALIALDLGRDLVSRPPRDIERVILRSSSHFNFSVALINNTDQPMRILWTGHSLPGLHCTLYREDGPVNYQGYDLLPPDWNLRDVFTLLPGAKVVEQNAVGFSSLKPGEYSVRIRYSHPDTIYDPSTKQSAEFKELTPVWLDKWVSIKLIR
jgi:hypothetical protein